MPARQGRSATLDRLLAELEVAVRNADETQAVVLEQEILQLIAADVELHRAREAHVRDLMAKFRGVEASQAPGAHGLARRAAEATAPDPAEGVVYPVWFGTNRSPRDTGSGFGAGRHPVMSYGRVDVYVPQAHRFGETGSPFWKRLWRRDLRDDRLHIQQIVVSERDAVFGEIRASIADIRKDESRTHALLFIHGYNVDFEGAAIRAAQIGCDLKVPGATAFFSWPSRGSVLAYPVDEATIEASEGAITSFLVDFATHCEADQVDVIAHSMGNRGLLRALQRIAAKAAWSKAVRLGQIILAAPDVDRDVFLDLADHCVARATQTTLYASDSDLAVHASSRLHEAARAGYYRPYTVAEGIHTVAVPGFDVDLLGHAYFAKAEALLADMFDVMRRGEPPAGRQRIQALQDGPSRLWKLVR